MFGTRGKNFSRRHFIILFFFSFFFFFFFCFFVFMIFWKRNKEIIIDCLLIFPGSGNGKKTNLIYACVKNGSNHERYPKIEAQYGFIH